MTSPTLWKLKNLKMASSLFDATEYEERPAQYIQDLILTPSEINGPEYLNRRDLNYYIDSILDQQDTPLRQSICSVDR